MGETLANLQARALDLADRTGSARVSTTRLTNYINSELKSLDNMIKAANEDLKWKEGTISVVSGTQSYAVPTDFRKLTAIFILDGTKKHFLTRATKRDFGAGDLLYVDQVYTDNFLRYRLIGGYIHFFPIPTSSITVKIWYEQAATELSASDDEIPDGWPDGSDDYIIYGAAATILARDKKQDAAFWLNKQQMVKAEISEQLQERDEFTPHRIIDTQYSMISDDPYRCY